jgi:hypothetical protein
MFARLLQALGPLRIAMAVISVITVILMPAPGTPLDYESWRILSTAVAPAVVPILVTLYLLDILMATVFSREPRTERTRGRHFGFIILSDVMFIALLLAVWLPLVMALTE